MQAEQIKPVSVFYCYAPGDRNLLEKLEEHLSPLKRSEFIAEWSDREIQAGMDWAQEVEAHLNAADIILLLISPSFISSDICYSVQMHQALEKHTAGKVKVIPIILRPTLWEATPLGTLQRLPRNGRAITKWRNRDAAFLDVVIDIWVTIKEMFRDRFEPYFIDMLMQQEIKRRQEIEMYIKEKQQKEQEIGISNQGQEEQAKQENERQAQAKREEESTTVIQVTGQFRSGKLLALGTYSRILHARSSTYRETMPTISLEEIEASYRFDVRYTYYPVATQEIDEELKYKILLYSNRFFKWRRSKMIRSWKDKLEAR